MKKRIITIWIFAAIFVILITDAKTASSGVLEGLELCYRVLIPAIFPFMIITVHMNTLLTGLRIPGMRYLGRLLRIPMGGDSILLLGMLGGYPVGAQLIGELFQKAKIDKRTGHILLGYCSNAGPAFIFGVTGILFSDPWIPFQLWMIHILSAICVGLLLPKPTQKIIQIEESSSCSFLFSIQKCIRVCASVCAWVIIFKIVQVYLGKWVDMNMHNYTHCILNGILELSNGCIHLNCIHDESMRFILCSGLLAFGGICVIMQTTSVTAKLGLGFYLPGKLMQTAISILLSSVLCVGAIGIKTLISIWIPCSIIVIAIWFMIKKDVENTKRIMYNAIIEA